MPELPEVETIARDLDAAVAGAVIARVRVYRRDILRACTPRTLDARTAGSSIVRWWRRAKHAVADLSNGERIVISPRFTGAVLVEAAAWTRGRHDYTTLAFSLADGRAMRYRDVRRLGTVSLLDPAAFAAWEARLGPEPLDPSFTTKAFAAQIAPSRSAIKAVLMDQRRIAGIGNIYANEALWRARIGASRAAHSLTPVERRRLHREVRAVLAEAVAQRGTSFRDYQDPHGGRGGFLASAKAYGRGGQPCARCGARLRTTHAIGNRITVWCPRCQR